MPRRQDYANEAGRRGLAPEGTAPVYARLPRPDFVLSATTALCPATTLVKVAVVGAAKERIPECIVDILITKSRGPNFDP